MSAKKAGAKKKLRKKWDLNSLQQKTREFIIFQEFRVLTLKRV